MSRRRGPTPEEFAEEIAQHLELERQRLLDEGLSADAATRTARGRFGGVMMTRERFYESTRLVWLDRLAQDFLTGWRSLAKYPIAAAVAVLSLAGGIGSTTAMLIVRDALFVKPPPLYRQPDHLSLVEVARPQRPRALVPAGLYSRWTDNPAIGATIAAATDGASLDVRTDDRMRTALVRSVSLNFFDLLGVSPVLGRSFPASQAAAGEPQPAILSPGMWRTLFDGRADVVGQRLWIGPQPYDIVGVMPERFWFASMQPTIWTPLDQASLGVDDGVQVVVRRPAGLTPVGLEQQLDRELVTYTQHLPDGQRQLRALVGSISGTPMARGMAKVTPWIFGTAVLLTLIIACANVAILIFAQWTAREREISVRASLGASRRRILRLLLTESGIVAMLGGALGVCVTLALRGVILYVAGDAVAPFDLSVSPAVLITSVVITIAAGIAAGLGPALIETRHLHRHPLRVTTTERTRQRWRHALVVLEIGVTVALLVVTATLVDAYRRQISPNLGFDTHGLISARVENDEGVPVGRLLAAAANVSGVGMAGAASTVPLGGTGPLQMVSTAANGSDAVSAEHVLAGSNLFETLGVPMRAGRGFAGSELATSARVAILNETLARRLFPAADPVGARVWIDGVPLDVVGVVMDHATIGIRQFRPGLYLPLQEGPANKRVQVIVRSAGNTGPLVAALRSEMGRAAPGNRVTATRALDDIIAIGRQETLAATVPLVPLFSMGLFLTAAGIYGVLTFAIARRSRELATRVAIGAAGWDLWRLVTVQTFRLVALGSGLAVATTFGLTRVVRASGGGGSAFDTPSWYAFALPALVVILVSASATWAASRRVFHLDPALLLRADS